MLRNKQSYALKASGLIMGTDFRSCIAETKETIVKERASEGFMLVH